MRPKLIKISFTIFILAALIAPIITPKVSGLSGEIDLKISSPTDNFEPMEIALNMKPGNSVNREVLVFNNSTNPFENFAKTEKISGDDEFCKVLQLEVWLERLEYGVYKKWHAYSGSLIDFGVTEAPFVILNS